MRTAGFSLAAVVTRPVGGLLSDRIGPVRVLVAAFPVTTVMALMLMLTLTPPPELAAGTTYVVPAFALGFGTGGVFALVAKLVRPSEVGTVTGFVGAAGGLGGYFPPLVATVYVLRLRKESDT
ncbi:MAG: MFS transporter [Streptosporangiales bacterium]|nr:MFS transporter [Streptosporangiales bacterium]